MSNGNLALVMTRIRGASFNSPIAVFRTDVPGKLNAVFAATVRTQQLIAANDPKLVGVYTAANHMQAVEDELSRAMT